METSRLLLRPLTTQPHPHPHIHSLKNRPFILPLTTLQTSPHLISDHIYLRLFAIRSRNFDFSGLNLDNDNAKNGYRKKISKKRSDKRSKQRPWWFIEQDEEEDMIPKESSSGTFKRVLNSIWIFKVLTSYGWYLPFVMLSLLLATGPKAFLTAFSIPLGLSLVILVFQKLWELIYDSPEPRRQRKAKSPFIPRNGVPMEEEDDFEEEIQPKRGNRRRDYRSWEAGSDNGQAGASVFGGWDELVVTKKELQRARRDSETGEADVPIKEKLSSRSLENNDLPLLLRLLVALFPFLGSWTDSL